MASSSEVLSTKVYWKCQSDLFEVENTLAFYPWSPMVKTNSCLTQDSFWSSSMFRIQPCVHLRPEEEQMTDLESGASALLSNNETAVIA